MVTKQHFSDSQDRVMFEALETPQSDRVESTFVIDLRRHARFDTNFPGETFADNSEHVHVTITNLSLSGLRMEGRRETIGALLGDLNDRSPDTDSHAALEVHFSVPPESDHLDPVKVHCRTIYTRCAGKDTYQIGVKFVTFEEGRATLAEYLSYRGADR